MFQKKEKAAKIKTQKFKKACLFKNLSCLFFDGCKNEEEENILRKIRISDLITTLVGKNLKLLPLPPALVYVYLNIYISIHRQTQMEYINTVGISTHSQTLKTFNGKAKTSVTRLGNFLHFGQQFKAGGNNYFNQIAHIVSLFL